MKNYILFSLAIMLLTGCLKNSNTIDYRGIEPLAINPLANFPSKDVFASPVVDSTLGVTSLNLTAKYSFQSPAPHDIKVTFTRDDALIDKYNQTFGTQYIPLPQNCYEMNTAQAIIHQGSQTGILKVKIIPSKFSGLSNYIIAFTITDAEGLAIATNFKSMIYTLRGK